MQPAPQIAPRLAEEPAAPSAEEAAEDAQSNAGKRGRYGVYWGVVALTPTFKRGSQERNGFQVLCRHPQHVRPGGQVCQKTRAIGLSGGVDPCMRLLKHWVLSGLSVCSFQEHQDLWPASLAALANNTLPSMEELEARAFQSWDDAVRQARASIQVPSASHGSSSSSANAVGAPPPPSAAAPKRVAANPASKRRRV